MFNIRNDRQLTVAITVVPDGSDPTAAHLVYTPSVLRARPSDSVQWTCENGPFVIQFLRSTPLGKVHVHSNGSRGTGPIWVPEDAPKGRHPYAVAVSTGEAVYIDAGGPEIIIDD